MKKEEAMFLNACDDLRYGFGKKFFIEHSMENFDTNEEECNEIWKKAFEKVASDF